MKKLAVAVTIILFVSTSFADDKKAQVQKLLGRLRREPFHAELVCEEIVRLGEDAIPALESALKDEDIAARQVARRGIAAITWKISPRCFYTIGSGLGEITHFSRIRLTDTDRAEIKRLEKAGDLDGLLKVVRSGDPAAALGALEVVESLGREAQAAKRLLASVRSQDWFFAGVLLAHSPKKVSELVFKQLRSHTEGTRLGALTALIVAPAANAVNPLIESLTNKSSSVRLKAAEALGIIGDKRALRPLIKRLKEDTDYTVRAGAAWALGLLKGTDKAAAPLIAALKDKNTRVGSRAVESLAVVGDKAAIEALGALARDSGQDGTTRSRAIRAIGQIGGEDALEQLKPLFAEPGEAYSTVPSVLGSLGRTALPLLREALSKADEEDYKTRTKCQLALSTMGSQAVPLLLDLLDSTRSAVRLVGRTLLQRLTGQDFEYNRGKWEKHLRENPLK